MTKPPEKTNKMIQSKSVTLNLAGNDKYLQGHKIEKTSILPAAGYIAAVLDALTDTGSWGMIKLLDVTFTRALSLSEDKITMKVHLDKVSSGFFVEVNDVTYCKGVFQCKQRHCPIEHLSESSTDNVSVSLF